MIHKRSGSLGSVTLTQTIDPQEAVDWARTSAEQLVKSQPERKKLLCWGDLPSHLKWNEHIVSGYRTQLTFMECFRSLFEIHNETCNVWSHLFGVLLFAYYAWDMIFSRLWEQSMIHKVIFGVYLMCAMYAFGCSTLYHLFMCHSEDSLHCFLRMDYSGIAALIVGSYLPPLYYAYYCFPAWQKFYLGVMGGSGLLLVICSTFPFFHSNAFHGLRVFLYSFLSGFGIIPSVHMTFLPAHKGETHAREDIYSRIYVMYLFYFLGMICYIFKFPERQRPGKHDIWLSSHQLWHIFVLLATLVHFGTIVMLFENWESVVFPHGHSTPAMCPSTYSI